MNNMLTEATCNAVSKLVGKGKCIVFCGPTEAGKSTSLGALTENEGVQSLLQVRESYGKGSTATTNIMVTNHPDIPLDGIIVNAKIYDIGMTDVNDEGNLLGELLYAAVSDYKKNPSEEMFRNKIEKVFNNCLVEPANDSLEYKLSYVKEEDRVSLVHYIQQVDVEAVLSVYEEAIAKSSKKTQTSRNMFINTLKQNSDLEEFRKGYWERVIECISNDKDSLIEQLRDAGAVLEEKEEYCLFSIFFNASDIETELLQTLLKSENRSKEYFLKDMSIVFRGAESLFTGKNAQYLKVAEENGGDIYCLHLIDTQGLFHSTGVKPREEFERIVDILSAYHSNTLVLVMSAKVGKTAKDSYEAIRLLLAEATRNIDIYILYTHWDDYMKQILKDSNQEIRRFSFGNSVKRINWDEIYDKACKEQAKLTNTFKETILRNNAKHKPVIRDTFSAAVLTDQDSLMEVKLYEKDVYYPTTMKSLIEAILVQQAIYGPKYRVTEFSNCYTFTMENVRQSIRELYRNMVVDCKDIRLFASTVRACVRKWKDSGAEHKSDVGENSYGFKNIRTAFVQNIRNLGDTILKYVELNSTCVLDSTAKENFEKELNSYLKDNLGREIAMAIGEEAYYKGFKNGPLGLYQYEYFNLMITYTQRHFFKGETLVFGQSQVELMNIIDLALSNCVQKFVDSRCIEIY